MLVTRRVLDLVFVPGAPNAVDEERVMFSHVTTAYVGRWNIMVRLLVTADQVLVERVENKLPLKGDPVIVHERANLVIIKCMLSAPWINDVVVIEGATSTAFVPVFRPRMREFREQAASAGLNIVDARKATLLWLNVEKKLEALAEIKDQAESSLAR